jgi:hypothetical protein
MESNSMRESETKKLLAILKDKGPQTVEEVAAMTGMEVTRARAILAHMREYGYLTSRPVSYCVTPKGIQRAEAPPATVESKKRMERKKARVAGITAADAAATREARMRDALVAKSIRTRPALEQAWGAFA